MTQTFVANHPLTRPRPGARPGAGYELISAARLALAQAAESSVRFSGAFAAGALLGLRIGLERNPPADTLLASGDESPQFNARRRHARCGSFTV